LRERNVLDTSVYTINSSMLTLCDLKTSNKNSGYNRATVTMLDWFILTHGKPRAHGNEVFRNFSVK